jgi:hypothetical protein
MSGNLTVGKADPSYGNNYGNYASISGGGLLEVQGSMIVNGAASYGNMITNNGGIYQFTTAAPTIISGYKGSISLVDGTISFRGIDNADVNANLGAGALGNIQFSGNNVFMLNAASNTTASSQTYTFNTGRPNGPSNYVGLAMVNGATAYRDSGGGKVTIGANGTFLAKDTTAVMDMSFANAGAAVVDNASVNFSGPFDNTGVLTLRNNGSITGAYLGTIGGTLRGNGTVAPDAGATTVTGTVSPGESIGTINFTGDLTLQGTYAADINTTTATADKLNVSGELILISAPTLTLTDLGGNQTLALGTKLTLIDYDGTWDGGTFAGYADGQEFTLFNNEWKIDYDDAGGLVTLTVIPEPSALTLVGVGLLLLVATRRRRA